MSPTVVDETAAALDSESDIGLSAFLDLQAGDGDRYRVPRLACNMAGEIFGGQLLGSALQAAMASCPGRHPHMMQAFFLRSGRADIPLEAEVERSKDGRRFAHRRVGLRQPGKLLLSAEVSFHDNASVLDQQAATMPEVPAPETLVDVIELAERYRGVLSEDDRQRLRARPSMEIRPCDPEAGFIRPARTPRMRTWIRPAGTLPDSSAAHYAALAFMSDNWLVATCTSTQEPSFFAGRYAPASINHALWIHRPPRLDDWLLFETESPIVHGGRGLGRGSLYQRSGELIASATQECFIRVGAVPDRPPAS